MATITRTAWTDDDGSGTTGSVINNAEKTTLYNQIDAAVPDNSIDLADVTEWTTPAFSAAVFTGAGAQTWTVATGDRLTFAYKIIGKTMYFNWKVDTSTVGGTPNAVLQITLPASKLSARALNLMHISNDNGTYATSLAQVAAGSAILSLYRSIAGSGNWLASTDLSGSFGSIVIEIQ